MKEEIDWMKSRSQGEEKGMKEEIGGKKKPSAKCACCQGRNKKSELTTSEHDTEAPQPLSPRRERCAWCRSPFTNEGHVVQCRECPKEWAGANPPKEGAEEDDQVRHEDIEKRDLAKMQGGSNSVSVFDYKNRASGINAPMISALGSFQGWQELR